MIRFGQRDYQLGVFLVITSLVLDRVGAQLPLAWKPKDAVTFFCERWYHQSVVKNDTLFIDGGIQSFNVPGSADQYRTNSTLGHNPYLLKVDLRDSWDWRLNISYNALDPNKDPDTGARVRNTMIAGSVLHGRYDDPCIYAYGGRSPGSRESFPDDTNGSTEPSEKSKVWSFGIATNKTQSWKTVNSSDIPTPNYGAVAEAPDQGLAFYLNGRIDDRPSTLETKDSTLLDGMVIVDLAQHTSSYVSVNGMAAYKPRIAGSLQYVPNLGRNGILIAFGGQVFDEKQSAPIWSQGHLLKFDSVDVFDIDSYTETSKQGGNGSWYTQPTSGDIPPPRIDFCTILASAPDNSSYNVWLYGGRDPTTSGNTTFYDDVYVLSLPSFIWVKVFEGSKPRWGHTCHLVGGNQMLTVGGRNQHDSICDWHITGVGVLDLSRVVWGSFYDAGGNSRQLNHKLVDKIGGFLSGGATKSMPEKGWASKEFETVMRTTRVYDRFSGTVKIIPLETPSTGPGPQTSHASQTNSKARNAIIASAILGGIVLAGCIGWLAFVYRRELTIMPATISDSRSVSKEVSDTGKFELLGYESKVEASVSQGRNEIHGSPVPIEADSRHAPVVELPTTNFGTHGRWGIPILRVKSTSSEGNRSPIQNDYESHQRWSGGDENAFIAPRHN